jgi:hypothetical protein
MIFASGEISRISCAALMPSITGMFMSRRMMSGFNSTTFSMASFPFLASPQIRNGWPLRSLRTEVRAIKWSSTMRIRFRNWPPLRYFRLRRKGRDFGPKPAAYRHRAGLSVQYRRGPNRPRPGTGDQHVLVLLSNRTVSRTLTSDFFLSFTMRLYRSCGYFRVYG